MLHPKETEVHGKKYTLSRFNALDGLEIASRVPMSMPGLGDVNKCLEAVPLIMKYVHVKIGENIIPLSTKDLITNHTSSDWPTECLMILIKEMMEHNFSFFADGRASSLFDGVAQKFEALTTKIFTESLARLSQTEKPASTS